MVIKKIMGIALSAICLTSATALAISAHTTAFAATSDSPSPDNDYTVSVEISSEDKAIVPLDKVPEGSYVLAVQPWYLEEELPAPTFTAQLDEEEAVSLAQNEYMYDAYTANFYIPDDSTQFVIETSYPQTITIDVILYPFVQTSPLPQTDGSKATLTQWQNYEYSLSYTGDTGYFTMIPNSSVTDAEFGIEMKSNPNNFTGTSIPNASYPVYLENGHDYFFSVAYLGAPSGADTADVYFTFEKWTAQPINERQIVYAPVATSIATARNYVLPINVVSRPDDYVLRLSDTPSFTYGTTIRAFVVGENGAIEMTASSDVNVFDIKITENTTGIFFTTDIGREFVAGAIVSVAPSPTVNITLGTPADVSLKANETLACFVQNITESANYNVTISDVYVNGEASEVSPVSVSDAYDSSIVAEGMTTGMFPVVLEYPNQYGYPGEESKNAALNFTNHGELPVTFKVTVQKSTGNYTFAVETTRQITQQPQSNTTYFVSGLTGGTYHVTLTGASHNIAVYDYFDRYMPIVAEGMDEGLYTFDLVTQFETSRTVAIVVENNGAEADTFGLTFNKVETIVVGVNTPLTVNGTQQFYLSGLLTGSYHIALTNVSAETDLKVSLGEQVILQNGNTEGTFSFEVPEGRKEGLAALTFTSSSEVSFNVLITETVDGVMELGAPKTVTLGYNDESETYNIRLGAGTYTVTLEGTIPQYAQVFVIVDGNYVLVSGTSANFVVQQDATVTVEFRYSYYGEDYDMSFTFTATVTTAESR